MGAPALRVHQEGLGVACGFKFQGLGGVRGQRRGRGAQGGGPCVVRAHRRDPRSWGLGAFVASNADEALKVGEPALHVHQEGLGVAFGFKTQD